MRTGEPLLVYHGTTGGSFAVFDRIDDQTGPALAMVTSAAAVKKTFFQFFMVSPPRFVYVGWTKLAL